ncbi:MAG: type II toxin-antitoxin system HicA family toxin [Terracidiphilus sp.]
MGIKDLPLDSGKKIVKAFVAFGWVSHYGKNHFVLTHPDKPPTLAISIPDHKEVSRSLLKTELKKAGIPEDVFCEVYNGL